MITNRKLKRHEKENLAKEIRQFLIDNELWTDVRIYFNGKAFCDEGCGVIEDIDPRDYFNYVSDDNVLSMSFEGDFYGCLNFTNEYGADFDNRIQEGFQALLNRYGLYYELGNAWNLSCYYNWR